MFQLNMVYLSRDDRAKRQAAWREEAMIALMLIRHNSGEQQGHARSCTKDNDKNTNTNSTSSRPHDQQNIV